jgi:hypothetical protein
VSATATRDVLREISGPLRVAGRLGWSALGLGAGAMLLGAAAWMVRLGWVSAPYWVLIAWAVALVVLGGVCWMAWRAQTGLSHARLAGRLEELGAWRQGALTALLGPAATGTSDGLLALADQVQAGELARRGRAAAEPIARPVRTLLFAGLACLVLGGLAFTSAGPARGTASALWHPRRAWEATIAPVRIEAARVEVDRGDSVDLRVSAIGRRTATLWVRAPGERWHPRGVRLDSLGLASVSSGPLQSDLYARVTSGSRASDTVLVRVRLPVFLGSISVTAHYPSYLGLEAESVPTNGDTLILPAGTRLDTRGEATAPLSRASWSAGGHTASLSVTRGRFGGSFVPSASGVYRLGLVTMEGAPLSGDTVRLPIRLVADSAPRVEIPVPGADTMAPLSLQVPLIVDARDDHGVTAVSLESRRISRLGLVDSARRESLPVPAEHPDRAILTYTMDLNRRGLLPGDTVRYFAVATDNTPRRQVGRSREFVLRLPTMSEVRAAQRAATEAVAGRLDSITAESRRIERQTDDLAREQPRPTAGQGERNSEALSFEESKRAEGVAQSQQELIRQAEELKRSLEALQRTAEAAGVTDSAWQRQLREIRDQLERALSPELRNRLAALQQALKQLDAEQTKEALERLADAQKELREALERSRELFRRAAIEGDLANLTQESRDLAREQRQWNEQVSAADSLRAAAAEREMAARADSLAAAIRGTGGQMDDEQRRQRLEKAGDRASQAGREMQQAGGAAQQGQRQRAKQPGEQASRSLDPLGDQLQQERSQMQQGWREEVVQALDRTLIETGRLAERQLGVQQRLQNGTDPDAGLRAEQGAIEEGVQKLLDQVRKAGGKNALISPQIGSALGAAQQQMQRTREAIATSTPNAREGAEQAGAAVDALNAAAYGLLRARADVAGSGSGSGLAEAMERMAQLAQQQGGLGKQGAGLLPMAGAGAIQEQLRRLGAQQRALADELDKLKGQGNLAGAGEMADEAKDLAKQLEGGRISRQVVDRQERLFRRMLDAGRTLQGREEDQRKERQSTPATDDSVHLPPALRASLEGDDERPRVPGWEELQRLSPEERRLVVDYFRRLTEIPER